VLCKIKEEKKFEARLKELKKILNDDVKALLFEQLQRNLSGLLLLMRVVLDMGS
jgi:hypothetical protein